jgi:hypothetical protein
MNARFVYVHNLKVDKLHIGDSDQNIFDDWLFAWVLISICKDYVLP